MILDICVNDAINRMLYVEKITHTQSFSMSVFVGLLANPYDSCKDILRNGIRDEVSTAGNVNKQIAVQHEFCTIAKETDLNKNNIENFAKDYVEKTSGKNNAYGGGADVNVIGIVKVGANYKQSNDSQNMSKNEKIQWFKNNRESVLDYYRENCGKDSHDESLRSESVVLSKIANPVVVKAWRDCMSKKSESGFFADVIPSSTDMTEDKIEYNVTIHWDSMENTEITSIILTYFKDIIDVPYSTDRTNSYETIDICKVGNQPLKKGSLSINMHHYDRKYSANIAINVSNNTGMSKSYVITLPKKIEPKLIVITPVTKSDESYWVVENYCGNQNCTEHMKNLLSTRHVINDRLFFDIR